MARSNVDAIYAENPFLSKLISRVKVPDAQVKRWSEEFLASTPDSYPDSGSEKIYLVDENGRIVGKVDTWLAFLRNGTNETVGQALARIGNEKTRTVRHAVGIWNVRVILWKLPNGYNNAADWLRSRVAEAQKELRESA